MVPAPLSSPAHPASALVRPRLPQWISSSPVQAPVTTNQGWDEVPFQRWYRFKEAFAPKMVLDAIKAHGGAVATCYDPFGGGGTTSLVCQFLGIEPCTIEVNPFLADLIEAKLTTYDADKLIKARTRLVTQLRQFQSAPHAIEDLFPGAPPTLVAPGVRGRWIFDADVAQRIRIYLDAIDSLDDIAIRRLFRVLLGSILLGVSNVVVNGKGRRYRSISRRDRASVGDVDAAFSSAFERALFDVCRYANRASDAYVLHRGDARKLASLPRGIDLALFSPPYPNSFDYTDIYNVELWALGYLQKPEDNRRLREATLRSHVQIKRDFSAGGVVEESGTLRTTLNELNDVAGTLWNRHIPDMVAAYFADLAVVLSGVRSSLSSQGRVMMVVGNSRYAGVMVDVPAIVREIAPSLGLACSDIHAVRAMRTSAQQGGALSLNESLLVLDPC